MCNLIIGGVATILSEKTHCKSSRMVITFHHKNGDSGLDLCFVDKFDEVGSFSKTEQSFVNSHDLIRISIKIKLFTVESKFI